MADDPRRFTKLRPRIDTSPARFDDACVAGVYGLGQGGSLELVLRLMIEADIAVTGGCRAFGQYSRPSLIDAP